MWVGKQTLVATLILLGMALPRLCGGEEPRRFDWTKLQIPASPQTRPTASSTPDRFLQDQIGSLVKIATNGQVKTPSQRFLEELLTLDDRSKAPGRWIDELPSTRPAQPDLSPLPAQSLYFNSMAVNGHWPAFQHRNPQTAAALRRYGIEPKITSMPGNNFKVFVENWFGKMRPINQGPDGPYFQAMGEMLLYADFLIAHGDNQAKANALELLKPVSMYLDLYLDKHAPDAALAADVHVEIIWPLLEDRSGRFNKGMLSNLLTALHKTHRDREYLAVGKWAMGQKSCDENTKRFLLIERANAYGALKDDGGVLLSLFGVYAGRNPDGPTAEYLKQCLIRKFGPTKGETFYRRYRETLAWEAKPLKPSGKATKHR
jgi:hypothetical protein